MPKIWKNLIVDTKPKKNSTVWILSTESQRARIVTEGNLYKTPKNSWSIYIHLIFHVKFSVIQRLFNFIWRGTVIFTYNTLEGKGIIILVSIGTNFSELITKKVWLWSYFSFLLWTLWQNRSTTSLRGPFPIKS